MKKTLLFAGFFLLIVAALSWVFLWRPELPAYYDYKSHIDSGLDELSQSTDSILDKLDTAQKKLDASMVSSGYRHGPYQLDTTNPFPNHSHIPGKKKKAKGFTWHHTETGVTFSFVTDTSLPYSGAVYYYPKDSLYLDTLHGFIKWVQYDTVEIASGIYAVIPYEHRGLATIVDSIQLLASGPYRIQNSGPYGRRIVVRELPSMNLIELDPHKNYEFTSSDKFQQP